MKKLIVVFYVILTYLNVYAVGEAGSVVFDINAGARPVSMAGVFIAKADDVNTIWYNPAGIANVGRYEVGFTYDKNIVGIRNTFVSFILPFETVGSVGIAVLHSTIQDVNNAVEDSAVKVYDLAGVVGYSYAFTKNLLAGICVKYIVTYLGDYSAWGLGFDAGMLYYVNEKIGLGLVAQNIGTSMKFDTETSPLPLKIGAGVNYEVLTLNEHVTTIGLDIKYNVVDLYLSTGIGCEYKYNEMFSVRAGYIVEQNSMNGITVGAGISSIINQITFKFDYAFLPKIWADGDFDSSHMVSVIAQF